MTFRDVPSPNFGPRKDGKRARMIVMHYTNTESVEESIRLLADPARETSAHYLVGEDGTVIRLVEESRRAWHAGKSFWAGETDVNSASVGIEIQNPGHGFGYRPFPEAQMQAVIELTKGIAARHGMDARHIVAHSDVAPARKEDPGELFPWENLARVHGLGYWPAPTAEDRARGAEALTDQALLREMLNQAGYDPAADLPGVTLAFQRHFTPEDFTNGAAKPLDAEGAARLACCARERPWG